MGVTVRPYRRGGWEVDVTFRLPNGSRHRERSKAPVSSKSAAQRWGEGRERHLLQHGLPQVKKEVPTFSAFAPDYLSAARTNRDKASTVMAKESILAQHLIPRFGTTVLTDITTREVESFKATLVHRAPKTVNNILVVLSGLLTTAVAHEVIDKPPCVITWLSVPKRQMAFYDFEEFGRLVGAGQVLDAATYLAILLGGDAGLRSGEIVALRWEDLDLHKRQIAVTLSEWHGVMGAPKHDKIRFVPMTHRLVSALKRHRHLKGQRVIAQSDGTPWTGKMVYDATCRAAKKAGLAKRGVHILRHTFCSHLAMRGAPARAIQELAGHSSLATTQRYMHLSPAAIESAIRLLDGDILETGLVESVSR